MVIDIVVTKLRNTSGGYYVICIENNGTNYDAPQLPQSVDFDDLKAHLEGDWASDVDTDISGEELNMLIIDEVDSYVRDN